MVEVWCDVGGCAVGLRQKQSSAGEATGGSSAVEATLSASGGSYVGEAT